MNHLVKRSITILKWILFSTIGWIIGFILAMLIVEPLDTIKLEFFGIGLGIAIGIGSLQWILLKKQNHIDIRWIWFTITGLGSSYFLFDVLIIILKSSHLNIQLEGAFFMIIITLATALGSYLSGWLQYRFILRKYFNNSKSWILYNFLGWTICSLIISAYFSLFGSMHLERTTMGMFLNIFVVFSGGPIIGIITGKNIVTILKTRKQVDVT